MLAVQARDALMRAVQCDKDGRILEAQQLYELGIEQLMIFVAEEVDQDKRKSYMTRIKEYMDRADAIKARVTGHMQEGEVVARIAIEEDSTGHSYEQLFGKYMTAETKEIQLEETYIRENYQFQNLIRFLELAVTNCKNLKFVRIVTKEDPKNPDLQKSHMENIKVDLHARGIGFAVKYDESMHDRKIVLTNGFIITIGRGLNFYKASSPMYSIGLVDYRYRKCLQTDVIICRTTKA